MNPEQPVRDIMQWTMMNLEFIEAQPRDPRTGPFEVTQLVNSFLGALAHPWIRRLPRSAGAGPAGVTGVTTGTRIRGCDEHKSIAIDIPKHPSC
jgi:hypothetical protein